MWVINQSLGSRKHGGGAVASPFLCPISRILGTPTHSMGPWSGSHPAIRSATPKGRLCTGYGTGSVNEGRGGPACSARARAAGLMDPGNKIAPYAQSRPPVSARHLPCRRRRHCHPPRPPRTAARDRTKTARGRDIRVIEKVNLPSTRTQQALKHAVRARTKALAPASATPPGSARCT